MFIQRFLLVFFLVLGCLCKASTHPLTPRIEQLKKDITKLTYEHQFKDAQILVLEYLKQDDLKPVEIFYGYFLRADIRKSAGKSKEAIRLLLESKEYLEPIKDKAIFESLIYGNVSECYFNLHNHIKAKEYALRSIETSPNKSLRGSGHAVNNLILGYSNYKEKNYSQALYSYQEAIKQYKLSGDICEFPLCYNRIAAIYWEQGKLDLAQAALQKSFYISDSCDIDQYRLLYYSALLEYYKYQKNYKRALELSDTIAQLNAVIYNQRQEEQLHDLEIKYEMELTQKENEHLKKSARIKESDNQFQFMVLISSILGLLILLILGLSMLRIRNKKNSLLSNQLKKIEVQNKEREVLLKEIHHRVKNNLQVITSLLHLQANQNSDHSIQNLFKQSQYRINTMAMVHEMLYQSDNLSKIQLKAYLEELTYSLIGSIKDEQQTIVAQIEIPEIIHLGLDTAIPLGLLCNEIITNALIHGIPKGENGKLYIRIKELEIPSFILYIGDNGVGCPKDLTLAKISTLGLNLVQKLVRQLSGDIQKDSSKKGCHYIITFQEVE
ncbi:histidine kinase dimerization/phosphoacceptor domain -containing protein [Aureispira sp. CCB-QB1]|uniref:tetratricopeptide repeat-containing sensor histidine kinase n=1 Tax=Aureispira sp. CCB-QB1 TaxID=1313421 RepID=UPI00069822C5|nr:histidine kinase dimerization/phosphoacceptor domain -containing protein [Aureispira sp. CCB-QB1]